MSLLVAQSNDFWVDLQGQVDWYREHAAPEVAERFVDAVEATLRELTKSAGNSAAH